MTTTIIRHLTAICLTFLPLVASAQTVSSPNGNVNLQFSLTDGGCPSYQLSYKGKQVVNPSMLGLELAGQENLMDGFQLTAAETSTFDETWQPVWGETDRKSVV